MATFGQVNTPTQSIGYRGHTIQSNERPICRRRNEFDMGYMFVAVAALVLILASAH
jgi:hypothetical protein